MMRIAIVFLILFLICSCKTYKSPEEIYTSGTVENWEDFDRVDINDSDNDSLVDVYVYKYDEKFIVMKMHTFSYHTEKKTFRNLAFYYDDKEEGKSVFYGSDGSLWGEVNFRNGKEHGHRIVYHQTGRIIKRYFFSHGKLIYEVSYDDEGNAADTTFY